jgi:TPR repeat protein
VPTDDREAISWYGRAAVLANTDGISRLGQRYAWGRGVPVDEGRAVCLYWEAARLGDAPAVGLLGELGLA